MCTTAAKFIDNQWVLIKTRDPVSRMRWDDEIKLFDTPADSCRKWLVQNPDPHEDGYYGGINEHGVAYVSTFVRVAENQISYIRRPYVRLILEASTAREAVEIIESFNPRIGGNMFVADSKQCFGIEAVPDQYFVEEITDWAVKTNHFTHLTHRNLGFDTDPNFEAWSQRHQERAEELVAQANSVADMKAILTDRLHANSNQAICTTRAEDPCFTHSAMIFDTAKRTAFYAQGNPVEVGFNLFGFD